MESYYIEISKYGICGSILLYTILNIIILFMRKGQKTIPYVLLTVTIAVNQLLCSLHLYFLNKERNYLVFYMFIALFLLSLSIIVPAIYEGVNKLLLNNMCFFICNGLCIVSRLSFQKAIRQYLIILVSFILALFIPFALEHVKIIRKLTWVYGSLGIIALGCVLLLGEITHGSKISYSIGGLAFQPSEFVKILFVFFLAGALAQRHDFVQVALTAIFAAAHVGILVISKDLGSALIFFVGYIFVVYASTGNLTYLLLGFAGGAGASFVAYELFRHVQVRVMTWKDPWAYIDNKGWAITQSLFAMGSGSWFGMGLGKGNPTSIPYVEQDFVFSSICEEMGIIYGVCLILLTLLCFINLLCIATEIKDNFYRLIVFGIAVVYIFQIFLTVGGGMNFIPLTGVTLPFISYGGSSCMTTMIMFFCVQGIYMIVNKSKEVPYEEKAYIKK